MRKTPALESLDQLQPYAKHTLLSEKVHSLAVFSLLAIHLRSETPPAGRSGAIVHRDRWVASLNCVLWSEPH